MKLTRIISITLSITLFIGAMAGCVSPKKSNTTPVFNQSGEEIITLKWIQVGSEMPANYSAWKEHINRYLAQEIGVNIEVEVVSWGAWDNRRSIVTNGGEYFDILFTDQKTYNAEVNLGSFLDITELVRAEAPNLYSYIPVDYWQAASVNGKIYSVPTYKDSSATQYFVWDKKLAENYEIDYEHMKSYQEVYDSLLKIKEGENTAPFIMDSSGADSVLSVYDNMGSGLKTLGVRYDDATLTVVNPLEQEDVLSQLDVIHKMYQAGIINADAPSADQVPDYKMFFTAQGWSGAAKTTWGKNMGVEAVAIQFMETIVSNTTVRGSLNGIYSGTKYPEKCLQFLELVNLDSKVRDAFYYGLEGDDFQYNEDGRIERLTTNWKMAGYTQGTFFTVSQLATEEVNEWDEVRVLNDNATPSVLTGFDLDTSDMETELANCRGVYEKYYRELLTGAREPRALVQIMSNELRAAGYDTILKEAQEQVDAVYNK